MSRINRAIRSCALQVLYQFDAGCDPEDLTVMKTLDAAEASETAKSEGFQLAQRAWAMREESDQLVVPCAPEWPTYRQPMIDRNILRLAIYEFRHGGSPPKQAINGAVELAKSFGGEKSKGFVNAILDRVWKSDPGDAETPQDPSVSEQH